MTDIKPMRVVCRNCDNAPCTCSRARSGLDAGLLEVELRKHWYLAATKRCACGVLVTPTQHIVHVAAALASSGEAAPALTWSEEADTEEAAEAMDARIDALASGEAAPVDGLPRHSVECAMQDDDAPCFCGVSDAYALGLRDGAGEAAPVDGLREAAQALVDEWDAAVKGGFQHPLADHYRRQAENRLRAALAASGEAAPVDGLRAELLREALKTNVSLGSLTRRVGRFNDAWYDRMANELLAALAREEADDGR